MERLGRVDSLPEADRLLLAQIIRLMFQARGRERTAPFREAIAGSNVRNVSCIG